MFGTTERKRTGQFRLRWRIGGWARATTAALSLMAGLTAIPSSVLAQPVRCPNPIYDRPSPAPSYDASRLWSLNNRLIEKTEWLLDSVTARRCGGDGWRIESNARELLDSARGLRRALQRGGHPDRVLREFAELQRDCDRLVGQYERFTRGGWSVNAPMVYEIGKTCALMRQTLSQAY